MTQTTLSIDDTEKIIERLIKKFPNIKAPVKDDICYATQNRQDAVKSILKFCDSLIVIGSDNSSNSRRLTELAAKNNIPSYLIDNKGDINLDNFKDRKVIGITAGASAPEILINEVTEFLVSKGAELGSYNQSETKEDIVFTIPKELRYL